MGIEIGAPGSRLHGMNRRTALAAAAVGAGMVAGGLAPLGEVSPAFAVDPPKRGRRGFRPKAPLKPGTPMGTISIPALGLESTLREGIELPVLNLGPGHWPGSAAPGEIGNCVVAGHRVSHTRPFYFIDEIPLGATLTLSRSGVEHLYTATWAQVVSPEATDVLDPTNERSVTIFACHPRGSISQRFVVRFVHS